MTDMEFYSICENALSARIYDLKITIYKHPANMVSFYAGRVKEDMEKALKVCRQKKRSLK